MIVLAGQGGVSGCGIVSERPEVQTDCLSICVCVCGAKLLEIKLSPEMNAIVLWENRTSCAYFNFHCSLTYNLFTLQRQHE